MVSNVVRQSICNSNILVIDLVQAAPAAWQSALDAVAVEK